MEEKLYLQEKKSGARWKGLMGGKGDLCNTFYNKGNFLKSH